MSNFISPQEPDRVLGSFYSLKMKRKIPHYDDNTNLTKDLGFDSLEIIEFKLYIERKCKVDIRGDEEIETVLDLKNLLTTVS